MGRRKDDTRACNRLGCLRHVLAGRVGLCATRAARACGGPGLLLICGGAQNSGAKERLCSHLASSPAWNLSMCEGSGEPPKRTTGFGPILKNFAKEWEENPQQTLIKLFFFPLSPLFFPVPLAVGFKIYQYLSEGGG